MTDIKVIIVDFNYRNIKKVLWRIDPLLGSALEINETTPVARQRPACQWNGWKTAFSVRSAPMGANATMDTATDERCFVCGPCLDVITSSISECNAEFTSVQMSEVHEGEELVGELEK
jgi:hypothetical protein